ncbi:glycosyl transferase group 1 [Methanolacinia petrolearia DSM 11571]|uniref:Glycosyl transferase group 1 n=1 Tax=Methanolacinia petrolearia (strain DSM 11571 / OCM 486 / SEBR 4847) TaxID=679926 RepID=E1RFD9_METP4|nr:glycosyltransferase family 4 protein [Methanolacinia petrolearia]ADN36169.1 glycosyl transferase group 1 [Methanolacinia petrolearia DSM 11571]
MKIAFVYDVIYPYVKGGAEKRIYELSLRLAERGHEVHIFGMKYWDGPAVFEKDGIIYHGLCRPMDLYVKGRRSIVQAIYYSFFLFLPLLKERPDVIDCQAFPYFPLLPSWLVSKVSKCSLVVTWHEVWGNYWYDYLGFFGIFGKFIERFAIYFTKNPVAVSGSTARNLECNGMRGYIPIFPNGIDFKEINRINPAREYSDIIFVGRLIPEKNVDLLLQALVRICEKMPEIKAVIVGDGPEMQRLEDMVGDLGLTGNVTFMGFLHDYDDVIAVMKASKVFVLPSSREGFGIVAIEAMACGLRVVTVKSPRNAACDLIREGSNGYIADLSPESLVSCILLALSEKEEIKELLIDSVNDYEWDAISKKLILTYNEAGD